MFLSTSKKQLAQERLTFEPVEYKIVESGLFKFCVSPSMPKMAAFAMTTEGEKAGRMGSNH